MHSHAMIWDWFLISWRCPGYVTILRLCCSVLFFWNFVFWSLGKIKYLNKMFGVFQIKKNILELINHNMFGTSVWLLHYARYLLLCVQRSWWPFFSLYVTTGLRHQPPERPRCITTNGHYLSIGPNIKKNTNWGPLIKGAFLMMMMRQMVNKLFTT